MGVSWNHQVWFVCKEDETSYVESLPEYLPGLVTECPVFEPKCENNVVSFSSWGYNIYELFQDNFPRPESWVTCVHRISPSQGQNFDVVDWVSRSEVESHREDEDDEGEEDFFSCTLSEYVDPGSEYWMDEQSS